MTLGCGAAMDLTVGAFLFFVALAFLCEFVDSALGICIERNRQVVGEYGILRAGLVERFADAPELVAQRSARPFFWGIRPEQTGQLLAPVRVRAAASRSYLRRARRASGETDWQGAGTTTEWPSG